MTTRGASMRDVARRAEVSVQTVSRVARGEPTVLPATAQRVRAAMDELGYSPNLAARALRNGSFQTIGIVGHRISRTGEAHIVESVIQALRDEGYGAMLLDVASNSPADLSRALAGLATQVDGLVVLRLETDSPGAVRLPAIPTVLSDSRGSRRHTSVGTDHGGGTREAIGHLLELGHHTVHHIAGPQGSVQAQLRHDAWAATLREAGRPVPEPLRGDWTPASGHRAGSGLLASGEATAVFCANDEMALGLLLACHERGVAVPRDLSVTGFDDVESAWFVPPLTTVSQDFAANGTELVRALMAELRGTGSGDVRQVTVPARLVVRGSTAAPRTTQQD